MLEYKEFRDRDKAKVYETISDAVFGTWGSGLFGSKPKYIYPNEIIAEFNELAKKKIGNNATWRDLKVGQIPDEIEVGSADTSTGKSTRMEASDVMDDADKANLLKGLGWYEDDVRINKLIKKVFKNMRWDIEPKPPKPPKVKPKVNILPIGT
jgi:hypothetical protein